MITVLLILSFLNAPRSAPQVIAAYRTLESCQAQAEKIMRVPEMLTAEAREAGAVAVCYRPELPV